MVKRLKIQDETVELVDEMKEFYKGMEEHTMGEDPRNLSHRLANGKFDRDYMIREAVKSFLDNVGIEYEEKE